MKLLIVGDPHGELPKNIPEKKIDLVLCTGDLGKVDLARKIYLGKSKKELASVKSNPVLQKKILNEINDSSVRVLKKLSRIAPTYSILGNVGTATNAQIKKREKRLGVRLPYLRKEMQKIKKFHLSRNVVRNISGLKVGFLEYFKDVNWVEDFKPKDYEKEIKKARRQTKKAERILKNFGKVDILVCHQPPHGILDKVNFNEAPKNWQGKHAGSKAVLDYIKKYKPRYVFCGHIHESKGEARIGSTAIYNVGCCGDYLVFDL